MGRRKGFNDKEKSVVIKESYKDASLHVIAVKLGRHMDTVRQFLEDSSSMKNRADCEASKTVTASD